MKIIVSYISKEKLFTKEILSKNQKQIFQHKIEISESKNFQRHFLQAYAGP